MIIFLSLNLNNYLFSIYNMEQKKKDLDMGLSSEKKMLFRIKELFGKNIEMTNQYDIFDYTNETYQIELKTRRCRSTDYADIMVGLNKVEIAEETEDKTSVFLWKLIDGLYMWEYNPKQYTVRMGGTSRRGRDERKHCAFIPTQYLVKV